MAATRNFGRRRDPIREPLGDLVSQALVQRFAREMSAFRTALASDLEGTDVVLHAHGGSAVAEMVDAVPGLRASLAAAGGPVAERLLSVPKDIDLELVHRTAVQCTALCRTRNRAIVAARRRLAELAAAVTSAIKQNVPRFNIDMRDRIQGAGIAGVGQVVFFGLIDSENLLVDGLPSDPRVREIVAGKTATRGKGRPGDCGQAAMAVGLPPDGPPDGSAARPDACHVIRESYNTTLQTDVRLGDGSTLRSRAHLLRLTLRCVVSHRSSGRVRQEHVSANFMDVSIPQLGDETYGGRKTIDKAAFARMARTPTPAALLGDAVRYLAFTQAAIDAGEEVEFNDYQLQKIRLRIAGLLALHRGDVGDVLDGGVWWLTTASGKKKRAAVSAAVSAVEKLYAKDVRRLRKALAT